MFILDTPDLPLSVKTKDSIAKYRDNSKIQIESRYFLIRFTLNAISLLTVLMYELKPFP